MDLIDFDISIRPGPKGRWQVNFGPIQELTSCPFDLTEVENIRLRIENAAPHHPPAAAERRSSRTRYRGSATEGDAVLRGRGEELFEAVFGEQISREFQREYEAARGQKKHLRIRVRTGPDLVRYPFEIMYCKGRPVTAHLGLLLGETIIRSPLNQLSEPIPNKIAPPLRILLLGASPDGHETLSVEEEIDTLRKALELPDLITIETVSGKNTLKKLATRARRQEEFHILHYIGHGIYDADRKEGMLLLEDRRGGEDRISGSAFMNVVHGIENLRLVTLNSCLGAVGDGYDPLSAVASSLFGLSIPAVVAMQNKITDWAAVEFASQFYRELALGRPVDFAINLARGAVHRMADPPSPEWATPVLFMSTVNGNIFGLELPTDELLDHVLRHLRSAQWAAARQTAAFACEQHPKAEQQAEEIEKLATQAMEFHETWNDLDEALKVEAHDHIIETINYLAATAEAIDLERLAALLEDEPGACAELAVAVEAVKSFAQQEYQAVIDWCDQFSEPKMFRLELLRELAESDRRDQRARERLEKAWDGGDWQLGLDVVDRALARATPRWREELRQKKEVLEKLLQAEQAMADDIGAAGLHQALKLAMEVPADRAPANLSLFRQAVALGLRTAEATAGDNRKQYAAALWGLRKLTGAAGKSDVEQRGKSLLAELPGGDGLRQLFLEGRRHFAYRKAVGLFEKGHYSGARRLFEHLVEYQDSSGRLELCQHWLEITGHVQREEWAPALKALDGLAGDRSRIRSWRMWCRRAPKVLAALEKMAEQPLICESRMPWEEGDCPYDVFAKMGISPASTMADCKNLGLDAQAEFGGLSEIERQASDALRLPQKRLQVDFGLYTVSDPDRVRALLKQLRSVPEGASPGMTSMRIVNALKEDGGILLALCGERVDYEGAVNCFLKQARRRPEDVRALHHAGVAAAALIQHIEESDNDLGLAEAWEKLIVGWGATFADDRFWHDWWIQRGKVYQAPVKEHEIKEARATLQRYWLDQLRAADDVCPGLEVVFRAEINAGRAVGAGDGIPLVGQPGRYAVVGRLGARNLGLIKALVAWTGSFELEAVNSPSWQQRVCRYFSDLSTATALFEDGRYEEAIAVLAGELQAAGEETNPGFAGFAASDKLVAAARRDLLEHSHSRLALKAVSELPPEIDKTLIHWKAAVQLARRRADVDALLGEIRDVALGRAEYLRNESPTERRLQALDSAVKLLEVLHDEGWDDERKMLRNALIEAYLDYAVHLSNEYDDEAGARATALQAYRLAPEALRPIIVLCQASLHFARGKHTSGQQQAAEALLREVEGYLEEGERLFPSNADLGNCRRQIEQFRKTMSEQSDSWEEVFADALDTDAGQEKTQTDNPLVEAMVKEAQEKYPEAIEIYWDLVQSEPEKPGIREKLAICYRFWIAQIFDTESVSPAELRQIVRQAKERCPDSETLRDIFSQFDDGPLDD